LQDGIEQPSHAASGEQQSPSAFFLVVYVFIFLPVDIRRSWVFGHMMDSLI